MSGIIGIMEPEINKMKEDVKEEVTREGIRSLGTVQKLRMQSLKFTMYQ